MKGKKKMKKHIMTLILIGITGCATFKPPVKKEIQNKQTFKTSYESVWSKAIQKISSNGMAIRNTDKSSGLITFDHVADENFYKAYFDCGQLPKMTLISYRPINLNIYIEKSVSQTVTVNLSGSWFTTSVYGNVIASSECFSNGKFEQEMFDFIGGTK